MNTTTATTTYAEVPLLNKMSASHPLWQKLDYRLWELEELLPFFADPEDEATLRFARVSELREWVGSLQLDSQRAYGIYAGVLDRLNGDEDFWAAAEQVESGELPLAWLGSFLGFAA